ncbi:MAG: Fic family protein [Oscillospiraceae bacterium]
MNYAKLECMRDELNKIKPSLPKSALDSFEKSFEIEYAHNSTAIEGNTLTLIETKTVLEDNISVGGKSLREIYEVVNHKRAFCYVKDCIVAGKSLDENIAKDIHAILMDNILVGGVYRASAVRITGAAHKPPSPGDMYTQIKLFFAELPFKDELNAIELAAYTHAEFVKIHPFEDGNGKTSRLLMNYQLMKNRFLPISIRKENRLPYFEALEEYAVKDNLVPFSEMLAELEKSTLQEYLSIVPRHKAQER